MRRNSSLCLLAMAILVASGCRERVNDGVVRRPGKPDYVRSSDDKAMDQAVAQARATWPQFAQALSEPGKNRQGFSIKRGFRVKDDPEFEHIWLTNVSFDGQRFRGEVNNEPVDTQEVKMGDVVEVTPQQLSDWMYIEHGVLQGGYTIRVLVEQESPEEQEAFFRQVGFRFKQPEERQ